MPKENHSNHIIRKIITNAKTQLVATIKQLPVEQWTDADVNIVYEIIRDPDIQALLDLSGGGVDAQE